MATQRDPKPRSRRNEFDVLKKQPKPKDSETKKKDVALICGKTEDGAGLNVLRQRDNAIEAGVVRPLEEGKPIDGEVVQLHPRGDTPVCDVEVHLPAKTTAAAPPPELGKGPPQVASESYRKNWDAIYKPQRTKKLLN